MRSADIITLFRTFLVVVVLYLVLIKYDPVISILIFFIATALDGIDGYFAIREYSSGRVSFTTYLKAAISKDRIAKAHVAQYKKKAITNARFGPRMDIAGDRIAEYSMWVIFTFVGIVPIWIVIAVIIIHSFADAMMGARGTSSGMKTKFGKIAYSSNISRALINIFKISTFGYLILEYIAGWNSLIGYVLIGMLFGIILIRGIAQIYDSVL